MKKLLCCTTSALLLTLLVTVCGCKKNDTTPATQTVSYTLAGYYGITQYTSVQYTDTLIDTITAAGIQQAFTTAGVTYNLSKVTTAKLNALTLTAPSGYNFSAVSTVQVFLNSSGSAGLGPEIAHIESLTPTGNTAIMNMTGAELKSYLGTNNVVTILVANNGSDQGTPLNLTQGVILAQVQQ